jgi:CTP:molybdopterin cytidylyltransferase MocA
MRDSADVDRWSRPNRPRGVIAGVVLAGGAGTRFGEHVKQLAPLAGRPLLEHALAAASVAPLHRVIVVLGAHADRISEQVDLHGAEPVICERWREGMAASLRVGLNAVPDAEAVVILLGDQPLITAAAIERVLAARDRAVPAVRATYGGHPGHPVLLERELFPRLLQLGGDAGARNVLDEVAVREVACDDVADPTDIDTPEDLRALEARQAH